MLYTFARSTAMLRRAALLALLVSLPLPPAVAQEPAPVEMLGDEACRAVAEVYAYDATIPLEARVVEKTERDDYTREKIVFRGVNGFLVPCYLQLPPNSGPKNPCVLLLHGWSGSKENWWQDGNYISGGEARQALLAAGFAVLALDAQCHGDRIAENDFAPVNHYVDKSEQGNPRRGYFSHVEIYIQTTRDYRRAIDYLATRQKSTAPASASWATAWVARKRSCSPASNRASRRPWPWPRRPNRTNGRQLRRRISSRRSASGP